MTAADACVVVARNITIARELHGWSQHEAADRLERLLGRRWSKATYSAAERSVTGRRVRRFTADEIDALARTFGVEPGDLFCRFDARRQLASRIFENQEGRDG